jgi:hypothetical protein
MLSILPFNDCKEKPHPKRQAFYQALEQTHRKMKRRKGKEVISRPNNRLCSGQTHRSTYDYTQKGERKRGILGPAPSNDYTGNGLPCHGIYSAHTSQDSLKAATHF